MLKISIFLKIVELTVKKNVTFSLLMIRGDAPLTSLEAVTKLFLSRLLTLPPVCSASLTIPCAYNACSACTIYCACSACKAFYMPAMLTVTMLASQIALLLH